MKKIFRISFVITALALSLILCLAAFAETVEPETPELPAVEDAAPAEDTAPATDAAPATDSSATTDSAALQAALNAYRAAKQSKQITDLESELNEYVAAGTLTQEQADLILKYQKDQAALQNGTCPNCGYQFSSGAGKGGRGMGGRGGKGGRGGMGGKGMRGFGYGYSAQGNATQDNGAANGTAYEDIWTGMVNMNGIEEDI